MPLSSFCMQQPHTSKEQKSPIMRFYPSHLVKVVIGPLYPKTFCFKAREISPKDISRHHLSGYSVIHNHSSTLTHLSFPDKCPPPAFSSVVLPIANVVPATRHPLYENTLIWDQHFPKLGGTRSPNGPTTNIRSSLSVEQGLYIHIKSRNSEDIYCNRPYARANYTKSFLLLLLDPRFTRIRCTRCSCLFTNVDMILFLTLEHA